MYRIIVLTLLATHLWPGGTVRADEPTTIDIGSTRQLLVDRHLIDTMNGTRLVLHHPVRREVAISNDNPWEKFGVSYMVAIKDGGRFRAWYRCDSERLFGKVKRQSMTAYAESKDGIHWTKPNLGLIEFAGSKENNLVWDGPGVNMAVFKDENPAAPPDERYKAIVRTGDIYGLVSPDGLHWRLARKEPLFTERPFDSHNIAFWDAGRQQYVAYTRGTRKGGQPGAGMSTGFKGGVRGIRRATSKDFRHWTSLSLIDIGPTPLEHLYTNAAVVYDRAPGFYFMFPSRYANVRKPDPSWPYVGVNDIVFLSSRDGVRFERTFMEAFVRPGLDQGNWHDRSLYMERGILQTGPNELSMYAMENWRLDTVHIRRLTLRPDGFVSVQAPYDGGELVTRPVKFTGNVLRLNYSTSAVGSLKVEIQDAKGASIPGYSLDDCPVIYGDRLDAPVKWTGGDDVNQLSGRPVRIRFLMQDADLFAFRFTK